MIFEWGYIITVESILNENSKPTFTNNLMTLKSLLPWISAEKKNHIQL